MVNERNVWVIMALGSDANWEGNLGYTDNITSKYEFNNLVPNCRRIRLGDVLIIRDRDNVVGFARVLKLESKLGTIDHRRCSSCASTKFNARKTKQPVYRCHYGHEFDQPTTETVEGVLFTIEYAESFSPLVPPVGVRLLEPAYTNRGSQQSIRPVLFEKARSIALRMSAASKHIFDD